MSQLTPETGNKIKAKIEAKLKSQTELTALPQYIQIAEIARRAGRSQVTAGVRIKSAGLKPDGYIVAASWEPRPIWNMNRLDELLKAIGIESKNEEVKPRRVVVDLNQKKLGHEFMTTVEAATLLRCTVRGLEKWRAKGMIPYFRIGKRHILFKRSDVEEYLKNNCMVTP